jgi:hypothetical protein
MICVICLDLFENFVNQTNNKSNDKSDYETDYEIIVNIPQKTS